MGNRLFGCDACLDACPWNKKAKAHHTAELEPHEQLFTLDWNHFSRSTFKQLFKHSALERAGYQKLKKRLDVILRYDDAQ
jgi:epoxyqueuosine reductase